MRNLLKQRPGWMEVVDHKDNYGQLNFIWTQHKKNPVFDSLLCKLTDAGSETRGDFKEPTNVQTRLYNKLENSYHLYKKKYLFENMKRYYELMGDDPFLALPVTFHIKQGTEDPEFHKFKEYYDNAQREVGSQTSNIWIVKPGEDTNQGHGIHVAQTFNEIK